jgi:hypothetical protein
MENEADETPGSGSQGQEGQPRDPGQELTYNRPQNHFPQGTAHPVVDETGSVVIFSSTPSDPVAFGLSMIVAQLSRTNSYLSQMVGTMREVVEFSQNTVTESNSYTSDEYRSDWVEDVERGTNPTSQRASTPEAVSLPPSPPVSESAGRPDSHSTREEFLARNQNPTLRPRSRTTSPHIPLDEGRNIRIIGSNNGVDYEDHSPPPLHIDRSEPITEVERLAEHATRRQKIDGRWRSFQRGSVV